MNLLCARTALLGLTLEQFVDFAHSFDHQIDREDQNRETFLILDRTCKNRPRSHPKKRARLFSFEGKGFLTKDDFAQAFQRLHMRLNVASIESAFK